MGSSKHGPYGGFAIEPDIGLPVAAACGVRVFSFGGRVSAASAHPAAGRLPGTRSDRVRVRWCRRPVSEENPRGEPRDSAFVLKENPRMWFPFQLLKPPPPPPLPQREKQVNSLKQNDTPTSVVPGSQHVAPSDVRKKSPLGVQQTARWASGMLSSLKLQGWSKGHAIWGMRAGHQLPDCMRFTWWLPDIRSLSFVAF